MSDRQRSLARAVSVSGVGLHTGTVATVRVLPAAPSTGIVFIRTDLPGCPAIPATPAHAVSAGGGMRRTTLAKDGAEVQTVEHFVGALWGLGIDNVIVEISGPELPGLDGSAGPYVQLLKSAGIVEQDAARKVFTLREPVVVEERDSTIAVYPSDALRVSYTLSYPHPALKTQFVSFSPGEQPFEDLIAPARTFCLVEEVEALRSKGFGRGATYDNTLVIGPTGVLQNTLRFADEFVRHKILDLLGDLYLLGTHLRAHVIAIKSGHSLNVKLVHRLHQVMAQSQNGAAACASPAVGAPAECRTALAGPQLDVMQIQKILPHRYPFLLVDRITDLSETKAIGIKNVTINDYFFRGHFPDHPVMPGVLIVEAMAQVGGILILNKPEHMGKIAYFMSVDKVKFRKPVVPGDQLVIQAEIVKLRSRTGQLTGQAFVDGKLVCEGELMFALAE